MKTQVGASSPFPLSQGILSNDFLFVSGQIHMKEGKLLEGSIEEQTHQVMKNIKVVLDAAGIGFNEIVKVTIYVTDMSLYTKVNDVYKTYFSEPFPAREMICVKELPAGARLEISVIATKSK